MISSLIIVQIELQHRLITLIKECVSYCVGSTRGQNFSSKKCSKINFGPELKQDSELNRTFYWTTNGLGPLDLPFRNFPLILPKVCDHLWPHKLDCKERHT